MLEVIKPHWQVISMTQFRKFSNDLKEFSNWGHSLLFVSNKCDSQIWDNPLCFCPKKKKKKVSPKLDKIIPRMPNMFSQIQILIRISKFSKENSTRFSTSFRFKNFQKKKKKKKKDKFLENLPRSSQENLTRGVQKTEKLKKPVETDHTVSKILVQFWCGLVSVCRNENQNFWLRFQVQKIKVWIEPKPTDMY